jgi:hypothetical protein
LRGRSRGSFNGVGLDGLPGVAGDVNLGVREIGGDVAKTRAAIFVDERATPAQRKALVAMAKRLSKDRVEPFLKRARERTAEIKKRLASVDREALPPFDQEQFDKARRRVDDLSRALDQGDLEQSEEAARETAGELREVSRRQQALGFFGTFSF